jgi:hypothetical protein
VFDLVDVTKRFCRWIVRIVVGRAHIFAYITGIPFQERIYGSLCTRFIVCGRNIDVPEVAGSTVA